MAGLFLGIELGSTRIKAALIDGTYSIAASGAHDWENKFENGVWTYALDDVWAGVRDAFGKLADDYQVRHGAPLTEIDAIGVSAMMHGYLVFGKDGELLTPFRTWRNTSTERAAFALTELFDFNIPQRWSVAHLYEAVLDGEPHVGDIAFMTTLAGYVHWKLTGRKVLGVGDASGVFPVVSAPGETVCRYDARIMSLFDTLTPKTGWRLADILPDILGAGEIAGELTAEGAKLLDPSGRIRPGIPLCPPEGDAGTGMVATNSISERTGNISACTSVFAMIVLENGISKPYVEIDMVATPDGKPVAMVHCNNCTSDLDAWVRLFAELSGLTGGGMNKPELYDALYAKALEGDADCGGLLSYNYYAGEPITGFERGCPLFTRMPGSRLTLANFMRAMLFSTMATLKIGMDILLEKERARIDRLFGHGGLFKTKAVGQRLMAAALNVPVAVMESAGEGGAWGVALLAAYMSMKNDGETLEDFLAQRVFAGGAGVSVEPDPRDVEGFVKFMERYAKGLSIERAAVECLGS